ncbi:hypothetical protein [Desulfatibacillum aliphaticivorans]|uniref:hypothetical protein n=1 Tax=Desulfatibacillum aliphaticivorans TaxID=218208 RepID=UPI001B7F7DE5|nr:hypothetical protein [Desulfatibacillum aliphaticivorans]
MSPNSIWPEKFVKKLGVPGLKPNDPIDYMVERLLICVYQATENSSKASQNAARRVAASLGATFYNLDVEPLAAGYRSMIEHAVGRALTWEQDDIGLQNIQARTRRPACGCRPSGTSKGPRKPFLKPALRFPIRRKSRFISG